MALLCRGAGKLKQFSDWQTIVDGRPECPIVCRMENYSRSLDQTFAALADPTRRAMVGRLSRGDATVGELAEPFEIGLPTLLKHIGVLERCGLVTSTKVGRVRTCSLSPDALRRSDDWLRAHLASWESRLDQLDAHIARKTKEKNSDG